MIDRFKELTIVDDSVISDRRASNAQDGPWSFRHAVEEMTPVGTDPQTFLRNWFTEWTTGSQVNGYAVPDRAQINAGGSQAIIDAGMKQFVWCPWLKATPENACNADCSSCAAQTLDMAKVPFRLIAIVNRMDLREEAGINPNGEGRLVFGLTNGPADDPASPGMSMTIIFEYVLPSSLSVVEWAKAWHELGSHAAFDEDYKAALQAVTDRFVSRNAAPERPNGSALSQSRTNENALFWAWQIRQFQIGTDGQMHAHPLRNTPDFSLNSSAAINQFIEENAADIKRNHYLLPQPLLAGSTDNLLFRWSFTASDKAAVTEFTKGTCNGCHSEGANPPIDAAFHVSPLRSGVDKLSRFVNNPEDPTHDDLGRRTPILQRALCGLP